MNISKVLEETESFEFDFNGQKVKFDAVKASLTPELIRNTSAAIDYPKALVSVVKAWDLTVDDEGTKYPISEESLSKLPVNFLSSVLDKIGESWSGDKKKSATSQSGGEVTASSAQ